MEHCLRCKGKLDVTIVPEHIEDLGGIRVRLLNAFIVTRCRDCDEELTTIPNEMGLFRAAALARVMIPIQLSGKEVRCIRRILDMTQIEFAEAVGLDSAETISRWENGVRGIGGSSEKMLRFGVHALLHKLVPAADYDPGTIARMKIKQVPEGFVMPPIPFSRVIVKHDHRREEAWDGELPAAA